MPEVEWKDSARTDLLEIIDYISDDNPEAAQKLKDEIEAKTAKLSSHPKICRQGRLAGTREMVVHKNYIVVYTESISRVFILRVLHVARSWPGS
ncbi:type II toxin-antitoxin system RelE/ParE family toxin [Dyella nitratireducens]|uniref:Addiction module antitoxin n=1 Tax=Dyella nitratireducens TaxID=1849580 RepID=A0ABQ1GMT6_9GAMM|nr:type II toxin-antitoxin system RelE/ParE family toxin [Dyella nitratireducens]GGA46789.1 addiction module antitoxin [Dyella nitratireducens]GLQ41497.1 addiction module antitoxin [Dyella nitratireducens]